MKTFEMQMPTSLAEALALLPTEEDDGSAKLLAGGQDLLTEMKEHLVEPERLVNLKGVPGMDSIEWDSSGNLKIGALVTLQDLADDERVRERMAVLAESAQSVGSPQIRAMGTVGGNLNQRPRCWYYRSEHALCLKKGGSECFAFSGKNKYNAILGGGPSYIVHPSDLAPALVALGAEGVLVSPSGNRRLTFEDYYTLPDEGNVQSETRLAPNEILTHVLVPAPPAGLRSTYLKFQERGSYDFALAAVALCLLLQDGVIARARLVLGGVAPKPWRSPRAEQMIAGRRVEPDTFRIAAENALVGAEPLSENGYKIPLTRGLIARAFTKLA